MLLTVGIVLVVGWIVGTLIFHVAAGLTYAALALGLVLIVWHGVTRPARPRRPPPKS